MTTMKQNPWIHIPQFLSRQHSDILCKLLDDFPWIEEAYEPQQRSAYFVQSYTRDGGPRSHEHSAIHPALLPITKQVAYAAQAPVNFVQCHEMNPDDFVTPHKDPKMMIVPMLTLGQARTFRVGGKMPQGYYRIPQKSRKVSRHQPAAEILMNHGDLLVFTGGHVVHSMFPAAQVRPERLRCALLPLVPVDHRGDAGTRSKDSRGDAIALRASPGSGRELPEGRDGLPRRAQISNGATVTKKVFRPLPRSGQGPPRPLAA
jgi:hypothetical protein